MPTLYGSLQLPLAWVVPTVGLLATPGPTNTLMATTGASVGIRRSLPLITAEALGYLVAVLALVTVFGPLVVTHPQIGTALKLGCGIYLVYSAVRLWHARGAADTASQGVTFGQVLLTTLLNPKAMLFAFVILPFERCTSPAATACLLAAFAATILVIATAWIVIGASLRAPLARSQGTFGATRAGAGVLGVFAVGLIVSAVR